MNTHRAILQSKSVDETIQLGRQIGNALTPGDVIALVGPLGAGKTHLVKGIALGLGVTDQRLVNSPTFVIVNEYAGRCPIYHLDAYRLSGATELDALGFDEMCDDRAVVLVEWADRVADAMGDGSLWITLESTGETERKLTLQTITAAIAQRLAEYL